MRRLEPAFGYVVGWADSLSERYEILRRQRSVTMTAIVSAEL